MAKFKSKGIKSLPAQIALQVYLWINVLMVIFPFLMTVMFSLKSVTDFDRGFWAFPEKLMFSNYMHGFAGLQYNMLVSVIYCVSIATISVCMSSICAYVFTRHKFVYKEAIFAIIISLMIVPGVLSLTPSYLNIVNLNLRNTPWAIILVGISGSQVGAIFLFRTFMSQHPAAIYEAAKLDGAGDFTMIFIIAIPLSRAILIIQFLGVFSSTYNDFLWPSLVIDNMDFMPLMAVLKLKVEEVVNITKNPGTSYAMYLVSGIPLIFTSAIGLKYFISGEFASGMKL